MAVKGLTLLFVAFAFYNSAVMGEWFLPTSTEKLISFHELILYN